MLVALVAALDTQAAPVAINSVAGLQAIQNNLSGDYVLSADIDASGFPFAPIGPFTGTLDGAGHTIANLTIDGTGRQLVGLFSTIDAGAKVRNLNIANAYVTVGPVASPLKARGGILAGYCLNYLGIESISASGVLIGRNASYVGGLVGEMVGSITNSRTAVSISTAPGMEANSVGGIVGYATGLIDWSHSTGPVSAAAFYVGGLIGYSTGGDLRNSYSTSSVSGTRAGAHVGGLVGRNGFVTASYATGAVSGRDSSAVGGLVGSISSATYVAGGGVGDSYATGTVSAGASSVVGGLVGWSEWGIGSSYHTGPVIGGTGTRVGGIVGKSDTSTLHAGTVSNAYWNTDNAGTPYGNGSAFSHAYWEAGTGLTTAQLKSGTLPSGFDPSVWYAQAGSYPALRWQVTSLPPVLVGIFSRKAHGGSAAIYDYDLPLTGTPDNPTTEPRAGGANGDHDIVFTFDRPVAGGTVTVTEGTAIAAAPRFSRTSLIVPLTGVANAQYVTVNVTNVAQVGGGAVGSGAAVRFGLLLGDVNQSRNVTLSDMVTAKKSIGELSLTGNSYKQDVDASGEVTVSDLQLINAKLTTFLPAP